MKKLSLAFFFAAFLMNAQTASADLSDWRQNNCPDVGENYGRLTPVMYVGEANVLKQINKPIMVTVRGGLTTHADLTFSDNGATKGPKMCLDGSAYGSDGCPSQGQCSTSTDNLGQTIKNCGARYNFNQEVTITGTPRDFIVRVSDGGVKFPGTKGSSMPYCVPVQVYREPQAYTYTLAVDKTRFGSEDSFLAKVSGITWSKAKDINGLVTGTNAPIECGLLPYRATSPDPQYLCRMSKNMGSDVKVFPNYNSDRVFNISLRNTADQFDTYTFTGSPVTMTLVKHGQKVSESDSQPNGGMTNYLNCPSGEGVDPLNASAGCTRCQNIDSEYLRHISTCSSVVENSPYVWKGRAYSEFDNPSPSCPSDIQDGQSCSTSPWTLGSICKVGSQAAYDCVDKNQTIYKKYYGRVVEYGTDTGVPGVRMSPRYITAAWLGIDCTQVSTLTGADGRYEFSEAQSQSMCFSSSGQMDAKKDGYYDSFGGVGSEFDKRIPTIGIRKFGTVSSTPFAGEITLSPSSATLNRTSGSNVAFTLTNGNLAFGSNDLDACYEIVYRAKDAFTPVTIDRPANPSICSWITNWANQNNDWKPFSNGTGDVHLRWNVNYQPSVWNIPGLKVLIGFRKKSDHSKVTYSILTIEGTPGSGSPEPTGFVWSRTGHFSPPYQSCSGQGLSPALGASCSNKDLRCTDADYDWSCGTAPAVTSSSTSAASNSADEGASEPQPSESSNNWVEVWTGITGFVGSVVDGIGGFFGDAYDGVMSIF